MAWVTDHKTRFTEVFKHTVNVKRRSASFGLAPKFVKHHSSKEWVKFASEDRRPTDNHIFGQNAHVAIKVFSWYTEYYHPDMEDPVKRVEDERVIIQYQRPNGQWREVDLYDPVLSYVETINGITITRTFDIPEGTLTVDYVLTHGAMLKHNITFLNKDVDKTFRVVFQLSGISGTKVKHKTGTDVINGETHLVSPFFMVGESPVTIQFYENLSNLTNVQDIIFDTQGSGSKCDIIIGEYVLLQNESLVIDPASSTWETSASADDAYQDDEDTWYETENTIVAGKDLSATLNYAGQRFLNVGTTVPKDCTIIESFFQPYITSSDDLDSYIYGEDVAAPEAYGSGTTNIDERTRTSASVLWDEDNIGSGRQNSPNIKTIIQELVERGDWGSGDDVGILIIPTSAILKYIVYEAYDYFLSNEPHLYIEWSVIEEIEVSDSASGTESIWFHSKQLLIPDSGSGIESVIKSRILASILDSAVGTENIMDIISFIDKLITDLGLGTENIWFNSKTIVIPETGSGSDVLAVSKLLATITDSANGTDTVVRKGHPFPSYLLLIDDTIRVFTNFSYEYELSSRPGTIKIGFPDIPSGVTGYKSIELRRDGIVVFKGKIKNVYPVYEAGSGKELKIDGQSNAHKLIDKLTGERGDLYQTPGNIIDGWVTGAGLSEGDITKSGSKIRVHFDNPNSLDGLAQVAAIKGWEFRVNPDDTVDFEAEVGSDKSATIIFTVGENCHYIGRIEDWRIQNRVYAKGAGIVENNFMYLRSPTYVEDATSIAAYGAVEVEIIERDIPWYGSLKERAETYLAKWKDPHFTHIIKVIDNYESIPGLRYFIGDTISLVDSVLGYGGNKRIDKITVSYSHTQGEDITLNIGTRARRFDDAMAKLRRDIHALRSPQIREDDYLPVIVAYAEETLTLYEKETQGDDNEEDVYDDEWRAQTFTPSTGHQITRVKLRLFRVGSPGTLTVVILATDGSGHPTGADLTTGTIDGDTLTTDDDGIFYSITLTAYTLTVSTKYALVIKALSGDASNKVQWRYDTSGDYSGGNPEESDDGGVSWSALSGSKDFMFSEWGIPT